MSDSFLYNGKWVLKKHFRTFVYSKTEQKLAESYDQYQELIASGLWFDTQELANKRKRSKPDGVHS